MSLAVVFGCLPRPCPDGATVDIRVRMQLKEYAPTDTARRSPRFLEYYNNLPAGNRLQASIWTDRPAYLYFASCEYRSAERLAPLGPLQSAVASPAHAPQSIPSDPSREFEALPGFTRLLLIASQQPLDLVTCQKAVTEACQPLWDCGQIDAPVIDQILAAACADPPDGARKRGIDSLSANAPEPPPTDRGGKNGRPGGLERSGKTVTMTSCESKNGMATLQADLCVSPLCQETATPTRRCR